MRRYANGKATGLVVDVGHYNTSVTALWEGMVLRKSTSTRTPHSPCHTLRSRILYHLTTVDMADMALVRWPLTGPYL